MVNLYHFDLGHGRLQGEYPEGFSLKFAERASHASALVMWLRGWRLDKTALLLSEAGGRLSGD